MLKDKLLQKKEERLKEKLSLEIDLEEFLDLFSFDLYNVRLKHSFF